MTERRRLDHWTVENMVRTLREDRDICLVLNPSMRPTTGMPRVHREGGLIYLHRYLLLRVTEQPFRESLLAACPTPGCVNPFHFERSMRRGRRVITHCPNGHEYTPDNVEKHGKYKCKTCRASRLARRRVGEHGAGYCRNGHRLTKNNRYVITTSDGKQVRPCRTCRIEAQRRYRERKARANG